MIFLIKVWDEIIVYVLGNDESTIERSECFSDLLNLIRSDVGEISKDDLLMISEEFIQFFDLSILFSSDISSTSHLWILINKLFDLIKNDFYQIFF